MRFPERAVTLKDGRTCLLRPATPDDAPAMIAYMKETAAETEFLLRYPDEVDRPPASAAPDETRKAQCCIGLEHAGAFQLTVTVYDADYNTHTARFNLSAE